MALGERLRNERLRLGLSQIELAAVAGLGIKTQVAYESDSRSPDSNYLTAIGKVGVDIFYVLTGNLHAGAPSSDESQLLVGYRRLSASRKAAVLSLVQACIEGDDMTPASDRESKRAEGDGDPDTAPGSAGVRSQGARQRASRHRAERMAALDQKAVETVRRAMEAVGEYRLKHPAPKRTKARRDDTG